MKALISPNENVLSYDGNVIGSRIAQVSEEEFPVAPPLLWIDCSEDCVADLWYYANGQILLKPLPPPKPSDPETI